MTSEQPMVPMYSIAKSFAAAAALLTFSVDDAMGELVSGLPRRLTELSLGDVLAHRSGLGDYSGWPEYHAAVAAHEDPWPVDEVIGRADVIAPGTFRYSNIGYLLVRIALERRYDAPLFEVLRELVLDRVGVDAKPFGQRDDWDACTHRHIDTELRRYHPGWVYPGTFAARVDDAAHGIARIMRGDVGGGVAGSMRQTLPVDAPEHPLSPPGYGRGLMTGGAPVQVVGHGGQGPGFTLFVAATADGARWHGAVAPEEGEDLELIRACLAAIRPPGSGG